MSLPKKFALTSACLLSLLACSNEKTVTIEPGAFTEAWPTALRTEAKKNKRCAIDRINDTVPKRLVPTFKRGETLVIQGWIFAEDEGTPPEVYVQLVGPALTYTALAQQRTSRPDVNEVHKLDAALTPGFELTATQNAEAGEYRIDIYQVDGRRVSRCDARAAVKIE